MTFSQMVEEIVAKVEHLITEVSTGSIVRISEEELCTYQYITGKSNPFAGFELVKEDFDEEGYKFYTYKKPLLLE